MDEAVAGQEAVPSRPGERDGVELERQVVVAPRLRATIESVARLCSAGGDVRTVADVAARVRVDGFGAEVAQIWLVDGPAQLRLAARAGAPAAGGEDPSVLDVAGDASLVAEVGRTRLPVVSSDLVGPYAPALGDGRTLAAAAVLPALVDDPGRPDGTHLLGVVASWFAGAVPVEVADALGAFASVVSVALRDAGSSRPSEPEADHRFRSMVDGLGAVIWEADPKTFQASFVSRRAEALLGYPVQRWLEPGFWAGTIHPADRDYAVRYAQVATAEGGDHELEYRMVAADGREVWIQDMFHVEVDEQGTAGRLTGVMLDITRRKRVEQALLESRERFASLARTLQASLLPPHLPEIFGREVAARYRPAEDGVEVVGDFYDLFDVGEEGWGVVIGDVCGKGPEAAALTALARYTVRAAAIRERRPSRVLALLSEAVLHEEWNERFCTAVYARVLPHAERVRVEMACGGHPPPLVLRAGGSVERVGQPGTLLGLFPTVDLVDDVVELRPGDALVLFTDGAIEAKRGGEVLGEERLGALVSACSGCRRAEDIAARLEDAIVSFQDGVRQDDLAIVVLRVPG